MKNLTFLNRVLVKSALMSAVLFPLNTNAQQAGTLDSTFGNNGVVYCLPGYPSDVYPTSIMDAQHRMVTLYYPPDFSGLYLMRNLTNGSPDSSFGNHGQVILNIGIPLYPGSLIEQDDSLLLICGLTEDSASDLLVARFRQDGSIDSTFGNQGLVILDLGQDEGLIAMALQPDRKILLTGASGLNMNYDAVLLRLLPDGTPDSSFGSAGITLTDLGNNPTYDLDQGMKITLQQDGRIVVLGYSATGGWGSVSRTAILRYEINGALDTSFANQGILIDSVSYTPDYRDIALQDGGPILIAGQEGDMFGVNKFISLKQYTQDGLPDSSFADNGKYLFNGIYGGRYFNAVQIQPDYKILATGTWEDSLLLMRFTKNGRPDSTFGTSGLAINQLNYTYASGNKIYLDPNTTVYVLGTTGNYGDSLHVFISRYHNDIISGFVHEMKEDIFDMRIHPNPATNQFTLTFADHILQAQISLSDITGKLMVNTSVTEAQKIVINRQDFPDGVYVLRIQTPDRAAIRKLIVSK